VKETNFASELPEISVRVSGIVSANLVGFSRVYPERSAVLEQLSGQALFELKISEWDIEEVTVQTASVGIDDVIKDLQITSIKRLDSNGNLKFAGAYGNFRDEFFLCRK